LRFSWGEHKNLTNQRKHRVSFEVAARVFVDANRIEQYDEEDYGEDRWITIGIVGPALLAVVYTVRDEDFGEEGQCARKESVSSGWSLIPKIPRR
jgi:uncharacterized DUF497 family protein